MRDRVTFCIKTIHRLIAARLWCVAFTSIVAMSVR